MDVSVGSGRVGSDCLSLCVCVCFPFTLCGRLRPRSGVDIEPKVGGISCIGMNLVHHFNKLLVISASLLVTSALLVVTRSY